MFLHKMLDSHQFLETIVNLTSQSDVTLIATPHGTALIRTENVVFEVEHGFSV